jgi:uncharacterized protein YjbI with pentapeptide repeats
MGPWLGRCSALGALTLLVASPEATAAPQPADAGSIRADLRAGRTVVLSRVAVTGELDLRAQVVRGAFKCRECAFDGAISAADATFERTLDVTGSTFAQKVDFNGATFRGPALFRAPPAGELAFERRADFSLSVFEGIASFSRASFEERADFQDARFAEVTFGSATFGGPASFARASFQDSATFGAAIFERIAAFDESDFRERADFGAAGFDRGATFIDARFGRDASFLAVDFYAPNKGPGENERGAAEFDGVVSSGNLDFTFSSFEFEPPQSGRPVPERPRARQIASFDGVVCGRSLVLGKTEFEDEARFDARLSMAQVQAAELVVDVDETRRIGNEDDRQEVLATLEESAKARGNLSVANDAHFERLELRSRQYSPVPRLLDFVFYRNIAGYFVRPFRPLLILLFLATVFAVVRYVRTREPGAKLETEQLSWRDHVRDAQRRGANFLTCLFDTFALAVPRWGAREAPLSLGERFQVITYRLLLVCALIGLANSNPTLRNMVDTLL